MEPNNTNQTTQTSLSQNQLLTMLQELKTKITFGYDHLMEALFDSTIAHIKRKTPNATNQQVYELIFTYPFLKQNAKAIQEDYPFDALLPRIMTFDVNPETRIFAETQKPCYGGAFIDPPIDKPFVSAEMPPLPEKKKICQDYHIKKDLINASVIIDANDMAKLHVFPGVRSSVMKMQIGDRQTWDVEIEMDQSDNLQAQQFVLGYSTFEPCKVHQFFGKNVTHNSNDECEIYDYEHSDGEGWN